MAAGAALPTIRDAVAAAALLLCVTGITLGIDGGAEAGGVHRAIAEMMLGIEMAVAAAGLIGKAKIGGEGQTLVAAREGEDTLAVMGVGRYLGVGVVGMLVTDSWAIARGIEAGE